MGGSQPPPAPNYQPYGIKVKPHDMNDNNNQSHDNSWRETHEALLRIMNQENTPDF